MMFKKCVTTWIRTHDLMLAIHAFYQFSYFFVVFSGMLLKFSPILFLQPPAEQKLTHKLCNYKFEVVR